jgi:7-cyano-7-deazaguanine synthase in queuosine biosynthesis
MRDLASLALSPPELGFDLLTLAALVQAADTRLARRTESQDTWTREITVVSPVSNPGLWAASAKLLKGMLDFLTGDVWTLEFIARPRGFEECTVAVANGAQPTRFDRVCLFSGGLDSLIGAVDALERGERPLLVSHAAEGATSESQTSCLKKLQKHYAPVVIDRLRLWLNFPKALVAGVGAEPTMRARSFLFIALGVVAGTSLGPPFTLDVPENGLIALNVPLDMLRLGSSSTRTTHPFYLARWNELLGRLGIAGTVTNPYWNRTKGEMVAACANQKLLKGTVEDSMSCASPTKARWRGHGIEHCGYCLPCLIRRAALQKAWGRGKDSTVYTVPDLTAQPLDTHKAEGAQVRSLQLAIARLKSNPGIEKLLIHKPGSLRDEAGRLEQLAAVYRRGMEEVGSLLSRVSAVPR